ncbi:MAG TPA: FtsX-like permease family protein [Puia sp.]|jgi:putative ABC transport system permease protein|nr:FtsX-like permease family protein [Puia sp.]
MFRNYWTVAVRQLGKQKLYSIIKIGGFALGIATCLLITLYIRHELSYDRMYANGNRLFRVIQVYVRDDGSVDHGPWMPAGFAKALLKDFPQVEQTGRIMPAPLFYGAGSNEVRPEGKTEETYEEGFTYADQSMLDMLGTPMIYGDRAHALEKPASIVISKRKADKYFPGQNPVGKVFYLNSDDAHPFMVGGVMADPPANSHLQYDFLISLAGHELWNGEQDTWMADNYHTYALLRPGVDAHQLQGQLVALFQRYLLPQMERSGQKDPQGVINRCSFVLQPVADIHLRSADIGDGLVHGDIRLVWLYGAVGVFILLLAVINFVNLSTARSASRAKEVGLRKVIGSMRSGLIGQFLVESLLLSAISFVLAVGIAWLFLPVFGHMTGARLSMPWGTWWWAPMIVVAALGVGLMAGWYPAMYLSKFRPVEVLKGAVNLGNRRSALRSVLVTFQFTTSVILIVATLVVYQQMRYILDRKMGYDKDQVMLIQGTGTIDTGNFPHIRFQAFKHDLLALAGVKKVSISDFLPVSGGKRNGNSFWKEGRSKIDTRIGGQSWYADEDYFTAMGMRLVKGRTFSRDIASDSAGIIINETMASKLGWADPVGKVIEDQGGFKMHIIGEVADFNFESVKDPIGAVVIHRGTWASVVAVKTDTKDMAGLVRNVGAVWKRYQPQQDMRYTFLDESYALMYADVERTLRLFTGLAVLAVVIACLGLFALSAYMAERRRREIGIRKVLGASVGQLTGLLTREFLVLVLISVVIASPVAYWGMKVWLRDYVYRIELGWWVFVLAGVMVVGIALLAMGLQVVRAAMANPAGSLRAE